MIEKSSYSHQTRDPFHRSLRKDDSQEETLRVVLIEAMAAPSLADEPRDPPPTLATLPKELIEEILRRCEFDSAVELVATQHVCKAFHLASIPDEAWRLPVCHLLPLPKLWLDYGHHHQPSNSSWQSTYKLLSTLTRQLRDRWTDEYRETNYKCGKYSRWAVDRYDSFFCWYMVLAVRIFTSTITHPQHALLEELANGPCKLRYAADNSTSSQAWWAEIHGRIEQLGPSQFLALLLLDRVVSRGLGCGEISIWTENDAGETTEALVERHLRSSWWGAEVAGDARARPGVVEGDEARRAAALEELFDVDKLGALAEWLLADAHSGDESHGNGNPRLLSSRASLADLSVPTACAEHLRALLWDADGVVCR